MRQVLPVVGGIVGAYFGGPQGAQIGFAIGSLIGNAVDPLEVQGNKLGDAPTQTAGEGGARAIVFGKGCVRAVVVIERGGRRVVKQRDQSGKGGGPVTVNERALWTYAIGIGEAIPDGAILRIWENEKLVYDVTPGSTIPEDTAAFAKLFRFYDGAEDQLPDPAIEAIYTDPDDAPYYRGTAYIVFPQRDLTDFGEAVPTYRVEVSSAAELNVPGTLHDGPVYEPAGSGQRGCYITTDENGTPLVFSDSGTSGIGVWYTYFGDAYTVTEYNDNFVPAGNDYIVNDGPVIGSSALFITGINHTGWAISADDSFGYCKLMLNGHIQKLLVPDGDTLANWWYAEDFWSPEYGGLVWFHENSVYIGVRKVGGSGADWNSVFCWSLAVGAGEEMLPANTISGVSSSTSGPRFWMHVARDGVVRTMNDAFSMKAYSKTLAFQGDEDAPAEISAISVNRIRGFGVDDDLDLSAFVYNIENGYRVSVYRKSVNILLGSYDIEFAYGPDKNTRVVFNGSRIFIQLSTVLYYIDVGLAEGGILTLGEIVAAMHARCGHTSDESDVSELTEVVDGLVIESTQTGAEAINSIIGTHWADPADYDGKIRYIKRGAAVVRTLTIDDLIDEPETWQRNNAIEYPAKVHFFGQIAELAYASVKATSARYSADAKVVGEASVSSPETFNTSQRPYEIAAILHKIMWTEAGGEVTWRVTDQHLDLVPTDCVGLSWAGQLWRARITQIEADPGEMKLKMMLDRQSAYTANLTALPIPPAPTPPQTGIVSDTVLAVMDIPALVDAADDLHIVTAMSGETDAWAGGTLQRSLDDGASFATVSSSTLNSIMGTLQAPVTAASPHYTDTTNVVEVLLYMDDEIEGISEQAFLSEAGAFALSWDDGGTRRWELMQYRDAELIAPKTYRLTTLHRGQLNTEAAAHPTNAVFVLLDAAIQRQAAQSAWIGTGLTHRAVSNGQTPDGADEQTLTYAGNSQREFPVAHLILSRAGDDVTATAVPRHRFGTDDAPIRSLNWDGYRWTVTDGANTVTRDGTADTETFDLTGWASPVSVTVAQLNRITGAGPAVSEDIA